MAHQLRAQLHLVLAAALLIMAILAGAAPASANPRAENANGVHPDTVVSSDGRVAKPRGPKPGEAVEVGPSEGTGDLADAEGVSFAETDNFDVLPAQPEHGPAETILGSDERFKITNTTSYPFRAVVRITSSIGGCTGWMISPDTVATAGHCIHGSNGWASNVVVAPGQNGTSRPYGTCGARTLHSVVGWTRDRNHEYDYGAVKLNCTVGNTTGWFGFSWTSSSLTGNQSLIRGYPGDKPAEQWGSNDQIRITYTRKLHYSNDTVGGMSGSPVYHYPNGNGPYAMAIHAYGTTDGWTNSGTRITQTVFNNLNTWRS
jgi:glutamyl endopeptidase